MPLPEPEASPVVEAPAPALITRSAHVVFFGVTRSGKSQLCRAMWIAQPGPRVAIDVKDALGPDLPGVPTVTDPGAIVDHDTCRAVPPSPDDVDWYEELYAAALAQRDYLVWLDEANEVTSPSRIPRAMRRFILQGLGRGCAHYACTPRPADIHKTIEAQAGHVFVFETTHPRDRKAISEIVGVPIGVIDDKLDALGPHEFLYWQRGSRDLVHFDAIDHPDMLTARIAELPFN